MKPIDPDISHKDLLKLIHYDPITGIISYRKTTGGVLPGKPIGYKMSIWIYENIYKKEKDLGS